MDVRRMRLKGGLVDWMCVGVDARGMGVDVDGVLMSGERVRDRVCVEWAWGGCGWGWIWM